MKMMKKSLSVILAVLMVFSLSAAAFAAEGDITVSVRVEGIDKMFYYGDVTVPSGSTALDAIDKADEISDSLTVTHIIGKWGPYITEINGLKAGSKTEKGWDGWNYAVNNEAPSFGVAAYVLKGGEDIVVYYADGNNPAKLPIVWVDEVNSGSISFKSLDTTYGPAPDFKPVTTENPITGYTLTWYDHGRSVTLYPNENGVCFIPPEYNTKGEHHLQISKVDEATGLPLVVRLAPDFTVNVDNPGHILSKLMSFVQMILDAIRGMFDMIKDLVGGAQRLG